MKSIIRWLANVSGVTEQIKDEACREIGGVMMGTKYWWNGGSLAKPKWDIGNAIHLYAMALKRGHRYSLPIDFIRKEVYKKGDEPFKNFTSDDFEFHDLD
jgi:hypothetical protein